MRIQPRPKFILLATLAVMYFTGVFTWVLSQWFKINAGFGPENPPSRLLWLQLHSVSSLWFLAVFGYTFHAHVIPSWRRGRKRLSGAVLTSVLIFLSLTVPALFYITNDTAKNSVALAHTYVGLSLFVIFILHYFSKRI